MRTSLKVLRGSVDHVVAGRRSSRLCMILSVMELLPPIPPNWSFAALCMLSVGAASCRTTGYLVIPAAGSSSGPAITAKTLC